MTSSGNVSSTVMRVCARVFNLILYSSKKKVPFIVLCLICVNIINAVLRFYLDNELAHTSKKQNEMIGNKEEINKREARARKELGLTGTFPYRCIS